MVVAEAMAAIVGTALLVVAILFIGALFGAVVSKVKGKNNE